MLCEFNNLAPHAYPECALILVILKHDMMATATLPKCLKIRPPSGGHIINVSCYRVLAKTVAGKYSILQFIRRYAHNTDAY